MCGIFGVYQFKRTWGQDELSASLEVMKNLLLHRGPDGNDIWIDRNCKLGLGQVRLAIIDLSSAGLQPMIAPNGTIIVFNGEIYNYIELRESLKDFWEFHTNTDTEVILALYGKYGVGCLEYLRGMFAFVIWDPTNDTLFCARDRFGIKPFYYTCDNDKFIFASETKALLPFLENLETNQESLGEYIIFQYPIGAQTLFQNINQLLPGYYMLIQGDKKFEKCYWTLNYNPDYYHTEKFFHEKLQELLLESVNLHLRSEVPVAAYLSGGIDSSLIAILANQEQGNINGVFHGRFAIPGYDESNFANLVAKQIGQELQIAEITHKDFIENINKVIYHLDFPIAGPGSFPQFMVSKLAGEKVKVILGGQGGDELFGGYARYLIGYFEQCINAAIEDTYHNGNFVVTPESIIPNLKSLKEYKPLLKQFWKEGLFESLDKRYLRLINRAVDFGAEIDNRLINFELIMKNFCAIFNASSVGKASYFDKMTHFDLKCLLPALLHVEDRMSMAHGLESRVPILDHKLAEFVANIPADIKFKDGRMKHLLKSVFSKTLPKELRERRDKMGFPVPLKEWFAGELKDFVYDTFDKETVDRPLMNKKEIRDNIGNSGFSFSRKAWGLLSLELWYQNFHDRHYEFKKLLKQQPTNLKRA